MRWKPWELPRASSIRRTILANFRKQKVKPTMVRTNSIYPLAKTGMVLCFVDPSTMVFGEKEAVTKALDARDGVAAKPADQQLA